jgi:ABC-2 type transport system ATP-binding protein
VRARLLVPAQREQAQTVLAAELGVAVHAEPDPAALTASIPAAGDGAREMTQRVGRALSELARSGIGVSDFAVGQPSLDEVFLALTGRPADPAPDPSTNDEKAIA